MVTASVGEKSSVVETFVDVEGVSHDVSSITSMSRNSLTNSVKLDVSGNVVRVEIANTEAMRIIELLN